MSSLHSRFVAWQEAERSATDAERRLFLYQRSVNRREVPAAEEVAQARTLRAKASALLRIYLEEMKVLAAACSCR